MNKLKPLRKKIDQIDNHIFDLLAQRFSIAKKLSLVKKRQQLTIQDLKREKEIYRKLHKKFHKKMADREIKAILKTILTISKKRMKRS